MTAARVAPARADGRLAALRERLVRLAGWRRYGLAAVLGVLAALALPPFYLTPLIVPAFTGLLWLDDGSRSWRHAAALGWCFGFGFLLAGLYWVGISMTVDLARFGWMIPFATGGLSGGLALYPAAALLLPPDRAP
ncbi:MAG: apolipoprotein N-acyltransferase, partial [Alphaproteobacteria bacterium]